jgi:hypothetical protein
MSSLVGRIVCNLLVVNKHLQATVAKHLPISYVKMKAEVQAKAHFITLHYSNLLTSSLRLADSNLVPPEYIPD